MLALRVTQLWHDRIEAQLVDRRAVYPADQGTGQAIHQGSPKAPLEKCPDGDVVAHDLAWQHEVEAGTELLRPGEPFLFR